MRLTSSFVRALPLAILLATTAIGTAVLPTTARADWDELGTWTGNNGTTVTVYQNDDGKYATIAENSKGAAISFTDAAAYTIMQRAGFKWKSDPGPDDNGKGTEPVDVAGLIAKGLITYQVKVNAENTPLAKWLDSQGGGFVPHWNPGDDSGDKGPSKTPTVNTGGPTEKQLQSLARLMNEAVKDINSLGQSMGDVGDIGSENAPGLPTNKSSNTGYKPGKTDGDGNRNNSGKNNDNGKNKFLGRSFDSLGPRPDLVNPPHSRTLSIIGPGLLGGDSGFSANGPSGIGGPVHGGSHGGGAAIR
jgi:hypothetical protein